MLRVNCFGGRGRNGSCFRLVGGSLRGLTARIEEEKFEGKGSGGANAVAHLYDYENRYQFWQEKNGPSLVVG